MLQKVKRSSNSPRAFIISGLSFKKLLNNFNQFCKFYFNLSILEGIQVYLVKFSL